MIIGKAKQGADVTLKPADLKRHALLLGSTGSGKTYTAKAILEEAALFGIPLLLLDTQGDLVSLARSDDARWIARTKVSIWSIGSSEHRRLALPLSIPQNMLGTSYAEATRKEQEFERVCRVLEQTRCLIPEGWIHRLAEEYRENRLLPLCQKVVADPQQVEGIPISTLRSCSEFIASPAAHLYRGEDLDLDGMLTCHPHTAPVHIIQLDPALPDQQKELVVEAIAAEVVKWMYTQEEKHAPNALFFLDEAAPYLPPDNRRRPACKEALMLLLRQARKYGLGCLVATQSPGDIDYKAFDQFYTWCVGRIAHSTARRKVESAVPSELHGLASLSQGDFYFVQGGETRMFRARPLLTRDGR